MSPLPSRRPVLTSGQSVAASRQRFLSGATVDPAHVRRSILASWRRSRDQLVAADRIEQPYCAESESSDSPLTRASEAVLRSLRDQLDGQPMSIVLTDPTGLVLSRKTGDRDLDGHLDKVLLAPGFTYGEQFVGTNGIGTALEVGGPTYVFGHEHYAENLEDLACAGVPIRHPFSGRTVGAIDLTCWAKDAGPLLLTLAKTTAEQIRQALLAGAGAHQVELLQEYLRTCSRVPGIVFAVSGDMVMMNDSARTMLDPFDQAALISHANEALTGRGVSDRHRNSVVAELPSGQSARMYGRSLRRGMAPEGLVVHVKLVESEGTALGVQEPANRLQLPNLVGSAPNWRRACDEVDTSIRSGEWLAVAGEPGVGKMAVLRAVHKRRRPRGRLVTLDAADSAHDPDWMSALHRVLAEQPESLVVRHVDRLDAELLQDLKPALHAARELEGAPALWVAVTLGEGMLAEDHQNLLRLFPSTVEVPPLRLHMEDLERLVTFFLARLVPGEQLSCSPEAMKVLMRGYWPGNAEQVLGMLRKVVEHRRSGSIQLEHLPPAVRTVSRRRLSQLESLERDAIVQSLVDTHGDKSNAARSLGMSRATIYRKIREYGIVGPTG